MRWAAIFLSVVLFGLVGLALWKGEGTFQAGLKASFTQSGKLLPVLVIAFLIAGFVEVLLPKSFVQNWLSNASGWRGLGVAWLAGALTPAGSLVGLPIAASLYKAGAGIGVLITYLTSLAVLSTIRIPLEIGIYGIKLTLLRIAASFFLPPLAGVTTLLFTTLFRSNT
ncbi:MAG: permease [Myxococcota bacterium]